MRRLQTLRLFVATLALVAAVVAPSLPPVAGQEDEEQSAKKIYVRTGQEATINGRILFNGKVPPRGEFDMSQDATCAKSNRRPLDERVIVTNGKLANVFVYIRSNDALDAYMWEVPSAPVVLDQRRCFFVPHVLGIQAKQRLQVLNSDRTTHNVNVQAKSNEKWNMSQTEGGEPIVRTFARPEMWVPIKCNQHPWMRAYVNVMAHPFFAVSNRYGAYTIAGLPPGDYTLVASHERFGERTIEITVRAGETKPVNFTFEGE